MSKNKTGVSLVSNSSGLGYIDLEDFIDDVNAKSPMVPLFSAIGGVNETVVFSETNNKLVFLQGFNRIKTMPLCH